MYGDLDADFTAKDGFAQLASSLRTECFLLHCVTVSKSTTEILHESKMKTWMAEFCV